MMCWVFLVNVMALYLFQCDIGVSISTIPGNQLVACCILDGKESFDHYLL